MKQIIIIILVITLSNSLLAQGFQGIATYKTKRKLDVKLDSTQMNSDMHQRMIAMLKKRFEKTYLLTFNKEASLYKEEGALEAPQTGGMRVMMVSTDESGVLYKNIKENRFASQNEVFGKIFLVQDKLEKLDWQLEKEVKNIGNYTCHKATLKRNIEIVGAGISSNGDNDFDEEIEKEPQMKEITITAWYTTQIPINSGPEKYYGLPGLILEVNNGEETMVCSKIVLNPDKKIVIKEPIKGKEVSQNDFDIIVDKKMKQEREKYEHNPDGNSNHMKIRIGN